MAHCHNLKKGQVLYCPDCGLELKVLKECKCEDKDSCSCDCGFSCCGEELKVRK